MPAKLLRPNETCLSKLQRNDDVDDNYYHYQMSQWTDNRRILYILSILYPLIFPLLFLIFCFLSPFLINNSNHSSEDVHWSFMGKDLLGAVASSTWRMGYFDFMWSVGAVKQVLLILIRSLWTNEINFQTFSFRRTNGWAVLLADGSAAGRTATIESWPLDMPNE